MQKETDLPTVFWAKTLADGSPGISVRDHCLNVGSVAEKIVERLAENVSTIAPKGSAALAACHDIGKISPGFQAKCPKWVEDNVLKDKVGMYVGCETDHAKVSQWTLQNIFDGDEDLFRWAIAIGAHHGRIKGKRLREGIEIVGSLGADQWEEQRVKLARELESRFGELPDFEPSFSTLWWLSGLITVADWIGSDEKLFPVDGSLSDSERSPKAIEALDSINWKSPQLKTDLSFGEVFSGFKPTALQQKAYEDISKAGVYLIEGAMGCGKTEAALGAAYQLISKGLASGMYFALPTQTTSNKIHERVELFLRQIEIAPNELRLAHGTAWLRKGYYLPSLKAAIRSKRDEDSEEAVEHAYSGRSWFTSSKRSLLATFGVGTVDQALLGVVAAKHFFVRQFGLAGKVVILDEVHSYDLFTGTLLTRLVETLRELKCTVLILSATLTKSRRAEFLKATKGAPVGSDDGYPLLTSAPEGEPVTESNFDAGEQKKIELNISNNSLSDLAEEALAKAEKGECVLWIRNTVKEAQNTYRLLLSTTKENGPKLGLLHARFPLWKREALENEWLNALGKQSEGRPKGCVLVATQVVEQSVDIDADYLITDLAPTDMLLQRAGRLWRHPRPERKGHPILLVHAGDLTGGNKEEGDAQELKDRLGPSHRVYAPYILLKTFHHWEHRSEVLIPQDIRGLIESTYAESEGSEPAGWLALRRELEDRCSKLKNAARSSTNILRMPALPDEEGVQTRWIEQQTDSVLLLLSEPALDSDGSVQLEFSGGDRAVLKKDKFELSVARSIQRNTVRVPRWKFSRIPSSSPDWLSGVGANNCRIGVIDELSEEVSFEGERCNLYYNSDLGVFWKDLGVF